jgi:repressor LexA
MKLTKRQKLVLKKIHGFIAKNTYPPTIRELGQELGFSSPRGVVDHLNSLERKGYIERKSSARSIKLTPLALNLSSLAGEKEVFRLPLIGRIAAGKPILAEENIEQYTPFSADILGKKKADFALRVSGDSMIGDHILDGDIIAVRSQNTADTGDIVVALIGSEAVVKRFYRTKDILELRSSNPLYGPIKIKPGKDLLIQGKVVAVQRSLS